MKKKRLRAAKRVSRATQESVEQAWDREIRDRVEKLRNGTAVTQPAWEAIAAIRQQLDEFRKRGRSELGAEGMTGWDLQVVQALSFVGLKSRLAPFSILTEPKLWANQTTGCAVLARV